MNAQWEAALFAYDHVEVLRLVRSMPIAILNARDVVGFTPLLLAIEYGWREVVGALLTRGVDIDVHHPYAYDTPLVLAARRGWDAECVQILAGGTPGDGGVALRAAAGCGHASTCAVLLGAGVDVESVNGVGRSALMVAVQGGHSGVAELLIEAGADPRATTLYGSTPLHFATTPEVVRLLVGRGADVNSRGSDERTPLMSVASLNGVLRNTILALLQAGADPLLADVDGDTVFELHWLRDEALYELVRYGVEPSPTSSLFRNMKRNRRERLRAARADREADIQERNTIRRCFAEFVMGAKRPPTLTTRRPMLPHELTTRIGLECEKGLPRGYYTAEGGI